VLMNVELHCHTTFSDGSLSVGETLILAREKGITHLAITDHDTTGGIKPALGLASSLGIKIIPGIEISAYDFKRKKRAHILGYYIQHIMHALVTAGYSNSIFSNLAQTLFSRGEQGQPRGIAYIPIKYIEVIEAIQAVRNAGGVPILAHPGQYDNLAAVPEWVNAGLAGLEVKHPAHDAKTERQVARLAQCFHLLTTGC